MSFSCVTFGLQLPRVEAQFLYLENGHDTKAHFRGWWRVLKETSEQRAAVAGLSPGQRAVSVS